MKLRESILLSFKTLDYCGYQSATFASVAIALKVMNSHFSSIGLASDDLGDYPILFQNIHMSLPET